ncbi:MAG: PAS domain-containing protein, partial [Planctomycetota bacterium]|nr:PAS domain-containing protein [Planctomycetota bacterium]
AVADGAKALEMAKLEPYELVLLDVDLKSTPGGLEICRTIKSIPQLAWMPVMFITGQVNAETVAKVFEAGGDEFVAKPLKAEEMAARARVLVRKGREERWLVERARKLAEKIAERDDELDDLRRFAQDIVSSLPSALLVLDAHGTILFANAPLLDAVKAERRDVVGRRLADFVRAESLTGPLGRAIEAAVGTGQPSRLRRIAGFLKSGDDRVSDLTVAPIDYAGVRQVLVVVEDVTEQARAEQAVALERSKLHDIVNAMNAALCLIGRDRKIIWTNRTFDFWFGDTFGQPGFSSFISNMARNDSWVDPVFSKGLIQHVSWSVFTSHGQRRFFANIVAPIKAEAGKQVEQALVLTQDVTEQETRVEQLSLLRELSQFLQRTLDIDRLHHVILLCVTAGHALGFNRAFLFKRNRQLNVLEPQMAVGPSNREDAFRIWADLSSQGRTLHDLVNEVERLPVREPGSLHSMVKGLRFALDDPSEIISRTALEKKAQVVTEAGRDGRVSDKFRQCFGSQEFVSVPMIAKGHVVGVILADNLYSGRTITDDHVKLLTLFAAQAALAIENAETYAELQMKVEELRKAQDKVVHAEKLAAVGKMAAHVAHEIRNPLSTIGGFARAILKRPENVERVNKNAKIIAEESTRLENMLKGVMDFSRPSLPVLKVGDLNAVAEKAFRTNTELLGTRHIHSDLDLDRSLPEVSFDEGQMLQVLHNLIRNAADSMPNGGGLTVKTWRDSDTAVLAISDTGSGIPADVRDRLFSPFITTKPDGTGLGLAVTKKIVDDHGGRIDFTSVEGKGTTFFIYLPLRRAGESQLARTVRTPDMERKA